MNMMKITKNKMNVLRLFVVRVDYNIEFIFHRLCQMLNLIYVLAMFTTWIVDYDPKIDGQTIRGTIL